MPQRDDAPGDLLPGLLALQHGLIDQAQLLAAFRAWTVAEGRSLAEILSEQGALDGAGRARLGGLVANHYERRAGRREPPAPELMETIAHVGSSSADRGIAADRSAGEAGEGRRYRVLRPHARGGLGEVFLALDPELNRQVALKELRAYHAHDPTSQSRFLREAEVTGRLEHPGIVPVYGLGRYADGRPFYAMRFIEGETLGAAIGRFHRGETSTTPADRELAFRRLLRGVIDACNAVAYAHSRGVVHRDLKPENIMLGRFGETLVVDWGVAKPLSESSGEPGGQTSPRGVPEEDDSSLTRPGAAVGTPRYMSPEQAAGDDARVGPASDVYGLGATLYSLLVGQAPFPEGDLAGILRRVRRGIFPAPRRVRRSIDPALEAICLRAMSLQPEDRYPSAMALAEDLERWLADVRYRGEQETALNQMRRSLARLCLERANNLFGRELHGEGMLWLARALENVPPNDPDLDRLVRASLVGWHAGPKLLERSLRLGGAIHAVAFCPEGRRLATACEDRAARLWDVATGKPLSPPLGHEGPVRATAFSPDGRLLASAGLDGAIRRWDALTGEPIGDPIPLGAPVASLRFSADGSRIAILGEAGHSGLWDAETGRPIAGASDHDGRALALAFAPLGDVLATACEDGRVRLRATSTGESIGGPLPHGSAVPALAFGPDSRTLLTGGLDGKAVLWDLAREVTVLEITHRAPVVAVDVRPDGGAILTACEDGTARLWDPATGLPIGEPLSHRSRVVALAFSPDGAIIATASRDGSCRFWDGANGQPVGPPLPHRGEPLALAFSPDARRLATGGADGVARCWQVPAPVVGDAERVTCWVRVATDLEFDEGDAIRPTDLQTRWELRRRLQELGGPPVR